MRLFWKFKSFNFSWLKIVSAEYVTRNNCPLSSVITNSEQIRAQCREKKVIVKLGWVSLHFVTCFNQVFIAYKQRRWRGDSTETVLQGFKVLPEILEHSTTSNLF